MNIIIINGPNLNMLGKRDKKHYGELSLNDINNLLFAKTEPKNIHLVFFQSNSEGSIIDFIQKRSVSADGILINPGALAHYGFSLRDALEDSKLPVVEVHLSDPDKRDTFRKIDVLDGIVVKKIKGLKENSYLKGLEILIAHIENKK